MALPYIYFDFDLQKEIDELAEMSQCNITFRLIKRPSKRWWEFWD